MTMSENWYETPGDVQYPDLHGIDIIAQTVAEAIGGIQSDLDRARDERRDALAEVERLRAVLANVEALHKEVPIFYHPADCGDVAAHQDCEWDQATNGDEVCFACPTGDSICQTCTDEYGDPMPWPCETARALASVPEPSEPERCPHVAEPGSRHEDERVDTANCRNEHGEA